MDIHGWYVWKVGVGADWKQISTLSQNEMENEMAVFGRRGMAWSELFLMIIMFYLPC